MGGARQTILSVYWCGDWRMGNFLSNDAQPFHNPVREGLPTLVANRDARTEINSL
jgi:hypothetical protein